MIARGLEDFRGCTNDPGSLMRGELGGWAGSDRRTVTGQEWEALGAARETLDAVCRYKRLTFADPVLQPPLSTEIAKRSEPGYLLRA